MRQPLVCREVETYEFLYGLQKQLFHWQRSQNLDLSYDPSASPGCRRLAVRLRWSSLQTARRCMSNPLRLPDTICECVCFNTYIIVVSKYKLITVKMKN